MRLRGLCMPNSLDIQQVFAVVQNRGKFRNRFALSITKQAQISLRITYRVPIPKINTWSADNHLPWCASKALHPGQQKIAYTPF